MSMFFGFTPISFLYRLQIIGLDGSAVTRRSSQFARGIPSQEPKLRGLHEKPNNRQQTH